MPVNARMSAPTTARRQLQWLADAVGADYATSYPAHGAAEKRLIRVQFDRGKYVILSLREDEPKVYWSAGVTEQKAQEVLRAYLVLS